MYDINSILEVVTGQLPEEGVNVLLIGGFAVNHYGYSRNTLDIDFMVKEMDQPIIRDVMVRNGFINRSEMDHVTFYQHPDGGMRIDFLSVDVRTFDKLMKNSELISLGEYSLRVPALCDLLAMKLFAITQGNAQR